MIARRAHSAAGASHAPTITAAAAAATRWQAIVVGAGPAGAATAWRLAAAGVRVLLLDRHRLPRGKVCGCCLSSRGVRELEALAPTAVPAEAVPLRSVRLVHAGRQVRVPLAGGLVISREMLDLHLLRQAIAAGCHWLPDTHASAIDDTPGRESPVVVRVTTTAAGLAHRVPAELVILATGLTDQVRIAAAPRRRVAPGSRIGVGGIIDAGASDLPAGELVMAVGRAGYCGVVRLEDGRLDVAAAVDRAALARVVDPAAAVAGLLDAAGAGLPDAAAIRATGFRATPPLTHRTPLVAGLGGRILRVGDAAGYVEPFTGEGMGWALSSARVLAEAALSAAGLRRGRETAERYVAHHRREFRGRHARCAMVAHGLRRPAVVTLAVAAAAAFPGAAGRLAAAIVGAAGGDRP